MVLIFEKKFRWQYYVTEPYLHDTGFNKMTETPKEPKQKKSYELIDAYHNNRTYQYHTQLLLLFEYSYVLYTSVKAILE